MDGEDHVRAGDDQILVAAFQMRPAEIRGREIHLLQHGAHRAIQDEDALAEEFAKGQALLDQIFHRLRIIPWQAMRGEGVCQPGEPEEQWLLAPGV